MIYGARSVLGLSETAHRFIWSAQCSITRIKRPPPATRIFRPKSGTKRWINMGGTLSISHPGRQQPLQIPNHSYPRLWSISHPIASHFTPLREMRSISSSGRSPLEPSQNDLVYRMSVSPRPASGRISPRPIEDIGQKWPSGKSAKRHPCHRKRPQQLRSLDFGGEADHRATAPPTGSDDRSNPTLFSRS